MINVREIIENWNQLTYGEYVNQHFNKNLCDVVLPVFDKLQITDKCMNGFSCEKLPKDEEGRMGLKTTYSTFFHTEIMKNEFSPASYLVSIIDECQKQGIDKSKYAGILARGLRSFTSLLREPDLASQLNKLINTNNDCEISLNAKQDSGDHTDILISHNGKLIRLWLYQFSSRGLPHDIERLTEKRGKLPTGIHILCPLHTEVAIDYITHKERLLNLQAKLSNKEKDLEQCSPRAIKKKEQIISMITKYKEQIQFEKQLVDNLKQSSEQELEELNGWFLYSEANAERISEIIISAINDSNILTPYGTVYEMLTAAEKFIGSNNIFIKEE